MSFYATISGEITYPNQEELDKAVKCLTDNGWMKDGKFVDECENDIVDNSSVYGLTLTIPYAHYRNLSRAIGDSAVEGLPSITKGTKCLVVWSSTDGCFDGGVIEDDKETCYDLDKWGTENVGETQGDWDEHFQERCDWQNDVEVAFHEEFGI